MTPSIASSDNRRQAPLAQNLPLAYLLSLTNLLVGTSFRSIETGAGQSAIPPSTKDKRHPFTRFLKAVKNPPSVHMAKGHELLTWSSPYNSLRFIIADIP